MYCRECGEVIGSENAVVCIKCGTKKGQGKKFCYSCGEKIKSENSEVCLSCGSKVKGASNSISGNHKNKVCAGLLALFTGYLGIHRFYLGYNMIGIIQLVLCLTGVFTCGVTTIIGEIWALIDCIMIFMGKVPDVNGNELE